MSAPTPRARILAAVGDLTDAEAVALLRDVADLIESGRTIDDPPPPRLLAVAGCPSEYAFQQHRAAGEQCPTCNEHMARLEGDRRNRHPEWCSGA